MKFALNGNYIEYKKTRVTRLGIRGRFYDGRYQVRILLLISHPPHTEGVLVGRRDPGVVQGILSVVLAGGGGQDGPVRM